MKLNSYTLPFIISLLLHGLVLGLVLQNWQSAPAPMEVRTPRHVQAEIVDFNPRAAEEARAEEQRVIDMRQREQERARREAEQRRQQEAERQRQARERERQEAERQAQAEREREREREQQRERERREAERREQERQERVRQQRLDDALAREEEFIAETQSQSTAQSYVALIAQRIEQNWSRPPSARVGMQVVLMIQLVPTGQVVDVSVVESSGNAAFDRSAEQAVKRVGRFTEVQDMPPEVFERHFRQLRLVFIPRDLRL
ncbi:cell envelope integrity protein TolA [Marinimicrobium sp. ABcell2]|uniref:cell envelope integrity protein TolA n=1 Tax=Marinimicrobium sp. ABcell2 TaxID=3069751 RepID=UPI0027B66A7A|nr:cell envelope integrity protein TolA [Marinimicrobium sp. ABcell2]MDQ2077899.1 cell envelope integrity protein TolA [Marinimicrobium sp. ABcell2]